MEEAKAEEARQRAAANKQPEEPREVQEAKALIILKLLAHYNDVLTEEGRLALGALR